MHRMKIGWEEPEEQEQHWAFPQPNPELPQQQQVDIPVVPKDGAPNSNITTTVSLSDGLFSVTHSASEEVNQGVQPMGMGLLNIALVYNAEEEEEDLQVVGNNAENEQPPIEAE